MAASIMPKPEILGSLRSSYTRAVCLLCEEKGIDYTLTDCLLGSPELFAIHPFGKMPVLRHGDFALFESCAIATYLDRSFSGPELFPSDPRLTALTQQWVSLVNTVMDGTLVRTYLMAYIMPKTDDGAPGRQTIDKVKPPMIEQLAILNNAVTGTGYLVGDQLTYADLNLLPILYNVRRAPEGAQALAAATHLASYYDRLSARASFERTMPPPGPPRRARPG
jgi:glutathione S-transferase